MRFSLLFFLIPLIGFGQELSRDSLFDRLNSDIGVNEKTLVYKDIARAYRQIDLDSAVFFARKGYELAKQQQYSLGRAENIATLGDIYVQMDSLDEAKSYYQEAIQYFLAEDRLFDHTQISMIIGNIYLTKNEYIAALEIYQNCLETSLENDFQSLLPHLYNNLGNLYLQIEDYEDALSNYEQARVLFRSIGDDYSAAIALSNISNIKSILGQTQEAIEGYLDVIRVFSVRDNWSDIARVYNLIAQIHYNEGQYEKGREYIELALNLLDKSPSDYQGPLFVYKAEIYTTASKLAYEEGRIDKAKSYARTALRLAEAISIKKEAFENARILSMIYDKQGRLDSALAYNKIYIENIEEYQSENDLKRLTQLKMQYEFDEILKEREIARVRKQAEYERKELLYVGILVGAILILIITVLLYLNQKAKTARISLKKENLELEKEKLNQEIDYKKKELASNMMYLVEKNEFLTKIARQLMELKPSSKKDNQQIIQQLINELRLNSNTKIWDEFELRFKEVHSQFYDALNEAFPNLTPNEIKLCAFLRLNMSTKEISSITHQSVKSINMARFRLRKKLNMDRDENLVAFLAQL